MIVISLAALPGGPRLYAVVAPTLTIDLATAPSEVTLPVAQGTYHVSVQNLIPNRAYHVQAAVSTIVRSPLELSAFKATNDRQQAAPLTCADLIAALATVGTATTEEQVRAWRPPLTDELRKTCPDQALAADALDYDAGAFRLDDETQLDVTITRETKTWHVTWKSEKPGVWLTSYGFTFVPSRDKSYFSRPDTTGGTYTIARETNRHSTDFAPSVFFTWHPATWRPLGGHAGFTGGLGFDLENPVVFAGLSWLLHQNVGIAAGLVMHKERDLKGKYAPNQQIHENLSSDDLTDSSYRPNVFVGLTFRFGQTPFKSPPTQTAPAAKPPAPSPSPAPSPPPAVTPAPQGAVLAPVLSATETVVWANPATHVYYCASSAWFGRTSTSGATLPESEAVRQGFRPAFGLACGRSVSRPQVMGAAVARKVGCGVERWPVKTLTDVSPPSTANSPSDVTVAELLTIPRPSVQLPQDERLAPTETTLFRLRARLTLVKQEKDGDFHLVIRDLDDPEVTMIAEVPSQGCAKGASVAARFAALQQRLRRYVNKTTNVLVEIEGVGFFDFLHNQTGVAPNGLELHPVIALTVIKEK